MQQLSGVDTSFLNMETATTFGHISQLTLYERKGFGERAPYEAIRANVAERLHLLPPLRRRLVPVPFNLDRPYWIEDAAFDLDFHVRHIGVPPPGDDEQLAALVARIIGRPLDRSRPLWELYVIEGLASGDVAMLMKMHHASVDGQSGMELLSTLLDVEPEGREISPAPEHKPEREPEPWELLAQSYSSLLMQPARAVQFQIDAMRALGEFLAGGARGGLKLFDPWRAWWPAGDEDEAPHLPSMAAPRTPFNHAITPHRRVAFTEVSLDELKRIKRAAGTTLNDVVMAICAGALRRYLERHGELPETSLVAGVPVSVRTGSETETYSNQVSMLFAELSTDEPDPKRRLARIHAAMQIAKEAHNAIPAHLLQDFSQFTPPALAAQAARLVASLRLADSVNLPCNVVISNVPGPRHALYQAGAQLKAMIPVSTVGEGMGLNITVVSYQGRLDFGLVACRELVPDLWDLIRDLEAALAELSEAY